MVLDYITYINNQASQALDSLSYVPYFDAPQKRPEKRYEVTIFSDMIQAKAQSLVSGVERPVQARTGGVRGVIHGFSKRSRNRMIQRFCQIRGSFRYAMMTLTCSDEFAFGIAYDEAFNTDKYKAAFEAFRRRFERRFPELSAIWKIELKPRKSGRRIGHYVPHYHLLVFCPDELEIADFNAFCAATEQWAREAWIEIAQTPIVECKPARNKRHAMKYCSEYIAKLDDDDYEIGRRWGQIGEFDTSPSMRFHLTEQEYVHFKRLLARWIKNNSHGYAKRVKRMSKSVGCFALGMGDESRKKWVNVFQSTAYWMVAHAKEIAGGYCDGGGKLPKRRC